MSDPDRKSMRVVLWRELEEEKPATGQRVVATDGVQLWLDRWDQDERLYSPHEARVGTHWWPIPSTECLTDPAAIRAFWDAWYRELPEDLRRRLSLHDFKRLGDAFRVAFRLQPELPQ